MAKEKQKSDDGEVTLEQNKQQIIKSIKSDIKKDVFAWVKKRGSLILTVAGILGFIGYQISLRQIHSDLLKFATKSITEKFAEPNIRDTLTEVAKNQAKEIIENEIRPEVEYIKKESHSEYNKLTKDIEEIKKEIALFKEYLGDTKVNVANEYNMLSNEVAIMKERNRLTELADNAIANGDAAAYEQLNNYISSPVKSELVNAARAETIRIKNFYITTTRIKGGTFSFASPGGEKVPDEKGTTQQLLNALANDKDWRVRARSAQLLKSRKDKNVPEALLKAIRSDPILDVRRDALRSFESLTGFPKQDVLEYESAINWWEKNKQQYEEQINKNKPSS